MQPLLAFSLMGLALVLGVTIGYFIRPTALKTGITFQSYNCLTRKVTFTVDGGGTANLLVEAMDAETNTMFPDYPLGGEIEHPGATGTVVSADLGVGTGKVRICVWEIVKVDSFCWECTDGSDSGEQITCPTGFKRSVLP